MLKELVKKNWPRIVTALISMVMFLWKIPQGDWRIAMIWLAAAAYFLVKLYQEYQLLKNRQK